jgi:hypothetical protein
VNRRSFLSRFRPFLSDSRVFLSNFRPFLSNFGRKNLSGARLDARFGICGNFFMGKRAEYRPNLIEFGGFWKSKQRPASIFALKTHKKAGVYR